MEPHPTPSTDSGAARRAPQSAVRAALARLPGGLVRSSDEDPGIVRVRCGKGFSYRRHDGSPVRDGGELQRIRRLAIPPAYRQVWICPLANGHLQATGLDARGRKQYRYHEQWRAQRDGQKFDRMAAFALLLPRLRRRAAADLRAPEHGREPLLAAVVKLLDTTLCRIGNEEYARENGSYGLTTLCDRHVRLRGTRLEFSFRGKSGVAQQLTLSDACVARVLRRCLDLPGQTLFRYADAGGQIRCIGATEVNQYLRRASGEVLSAKDFRTWHASELALRIVERAVQRADRRFTLKQMLAEVAATLGNTPAVCRKAYVHPQVLALATLAATDIERAAEVLGNLGPLPSGTPARGLRATERRLLAFLHGWTGSLQRRRTPAPPAARRHVLPRPSGVSSRHGRAAPHHPPGVAGQAGL